MSIQRRLAISITLVLVLSLVVGFGLTYGHVLSKVRTEMQAALQVAVYSAQTSIEDKDDTSDPLRKLRRIVAGFNGDRHVEAVLVAEDGAPIARSHLQKPDEPAPPWFYRLVAGDPLVETIDLPEPLRGQGRLSFETDAHNEIAEAWSDVRLTLAIMALFFAMVLALAFTTIKAALSPLRDVCGALRRIGDGDYAARIEPGVSRELEPLRDGVNAMALHLEQMGLQNRALNEQILNLQEEERAELARDLHDEVAPFLFAVGADAAMIRQYLAKDAVAEVGPRAEAIAEAVRHMQHHLKDVLRRLAPAALLDLGLPGAIDNLVGFWKARVGDVAFSVEVTGDPLDPPLDAIAFRVVQESMSNAMRHAHPSVIEVMIDVDEDRAIIVVEDDGTGLPDGPVPAGFGIAGMRERVRSAGGSIDIRNRGGARRGVVVEAKLPIPGRRPSLDAMPETALRDDPRYDDLRRDVRRDQPMDQTV